MKKYFLLLFFIPVWQVASAQSEKNYIIEIDGDSVFADIGVPARFTLKDGKTIFINVRKKEIFTFQKGPVSFSYPSRYSIATTAIDDDIEQILLMSASGSGMMIQLYSSLNPTGIVEFMLSQLTEDDINAGYKEKKSDIEKQISNGVLLKGKKSILEMDDEIKIFSVWSYGRGKKGLLIVEIHPGEDEKDEQQMFDLFWSSLVIKY